MKQLALAGMVTILSALPAGADVLFTGALVTTSATNCAFTMPGDARVSRYRPPGVAGNPATGGLTMFFPGGGYTVQFPGPHPALNAFQAVNSVETGPFGFATYDTRVKFTARTPATITEATRSVFLRGIIEEPFGEKFSPGLCRVGFEASLVRDDD